MLCFHHVITSKLPVASHHSSFFSPSLGMANYQSFKAPILYFMQLLIFQISAIRFGNGSIFSNATFLREWPFAFQYNGE
jgi:hypothetical protein